jgi:hypothetical protein
MNRPNQCLYTCILFIWEKLYITIVYKGEVLLEKKSSLDDARDASIVGAREDIMHISEYEDGYDLRVGNSYEGTKQKIDENGTT